MGTKDERKFENLHKLIELLLDSPQGLTKADIARKLSVHRSTASEYLDSLDALDAPVYEISPGRYSIDRDHYEVKISVDMHEALALHLASRLLTTRTDKHNPHAASALRKLGRALEQLAPLISEHIKRSADVLDADDRRRDPIFMQALETLTRAWSRRRKVRLTHEMEDGSIHEYTFSPYFIEPYAVGRTMHIIGLREPINKIRTFKIERIRTIELLEEAPYEIPATFDPRAQLKNAWGIWFTESDPVTVRLQFSHNVAPRIKETIWHYNQKPLKVLENGDVVWEAEVAEPQEMLPWIRGWGGDCKILEPEYLINHLKRDIEKMAQHYGTLDLQPESPYVSRLLRLWGKTADRDRENATKFHPAMFHLLDVGYIAQALLKDPASRRWRFALGHALGADPNTLHQWLPYFIAMHDIGKISAPFQAKNRYQEERLKAEDFLFGNTHWSGEPYHPAVGQRFIEDKQDGLELPEGLRSAWRDALDGHHGWFSGVNILGDTKRRLTLEPIEWTEWRHKASDLIKTVLLLKAPAVWPTPPNISSASMALTGFTVLCDWLGSSTAFSPELTWKDYLVEGPIRAWQIVGKAGLFQQSQSVAPTNFKDLFDDLPPPRPLQAAIDDVPGDILAKPCLAIIEAPTGEGKTEAAWALAHRLARVHGSDEIYFALPTMSTSNQMFRRFEAHLQKRLELPASQTQLIHSQAFLMDDNFSISLAVDDDGSRQKRAAQKWIKSDKRKALLMPFGVGTIDQAELAALNVPFVALRLMGLAGKVVIFDEVHAYDTYMTTIVEHLLKWLSALGASVILLSATLPQAQRNSLAQAYGASLDINDQCLSAYPCLLAANRTDQPHIANPGVSQPNRVIGLDKQTLQFGDDEVDGKANWLLKVVEERGCVCWITNTVERAQTLFARLVELASADITLSLLHASLPLDERLKRETDLENLYGPKGNRPEKGIVVGTQVLEQSLDLDFDLMASDLAPIDLMLQRAGRMHRHSGRERGKHTIPRLFLNAQQQDGELYLSEADTWVYDEYLLRLTWDALQNRPTINLPDDYRKLIETVYGAPEPPQDHPLRNAWNDMDNDRKNAKAEANIRLSPECHADYSFCDNDNSLRQTDDESSSSWFAAKTRREADSITVIPLERIANSRVRVTTADGETIELDLNATASDEQERKILRRGLRISRKAIVKELRQRRPEKATLFAKSDRLSDEQPLWLINGKAEDIPLKNGKAQLRLDPQLGLVIKIEKGDE